MTEGVIAGIVGGLIVSLLIAILAFVREKTQQKHEARMRLRDERTRAYSEMLRETSGADARDPRYMELLQTYSTAQLAAGGEREVQEALRGLYEASKQLKLGAEESRRLIKKELYFDSKTMDLLEKENRKQRKKFLSAAWKQLGMEVPEEPNKVTNKIPSVRSTRPEPWQVHRKSNQNRRL